MEYCNKQELVRANNGEVYKVSHGQGKSTVRGDDGGTKNTWEEIVSKQSVCPLYG